MFIRPPFRLCRGSESFSIEAADGRVIAYVYFTDEPLRRSITKRLTSEEAEEAAQIMARALREAFPERSL